MKENTAKSGSFVRTIDFLPDVEEPMVQGEAFKRDTRIRLFRSMPAAEA